MMKPCTAGNCSSLPFPRLSGADCWWITKVIVLAVDEATVSRKLQSLLKDPNNTLRVDDATKIVGCWKALSKQGLTEDLLDDFAPMQRAVAFCQVIEEKPNGKIHKVSSKQIAGMFQEVVEAYQQAEREEGREETSLNLVCLAQHVDGGMNATEKEEKLAWLKKAPDGNTCHILSNVRCLSEGVDVPALDAVLFLTPRNSQVDVVQSVGRVMRNAPGKKRGYIILPVVIPAGIEPHEALDDNRNYAVVWQVLQALRSHDDRFDAMINRLELNGSEPDKMEIIAISDRINKKPAAGKRKSNLPAGRGHSLGEKNTQQVAPSQASFEFEIGEIERAIYARLVKEVGNRQHWEEWAKDIARIAQTHIDRITGILENPANTQERETFNLLAEELRDDINGSIRDEEIIEMLAQHLITRPVFDALFGNDSFARKNPISLALQRVIDTLEAHRLDKESAALNRFYESVKLRAQDIKSAEGKQKVVVELYDKFFRGAFPKMTEKLGIVYTPVEVVDFIIHSIAHVLQAEFGQTLGSKGVHILDPFTGTGTFITRLLQSGLIKPEEMAYKYQNDIHANEIVLLAYYIAAINIETTWHSIADGDYQPFAGICLTDTFQLYEKEDLVDALLVENSARRKRQKALDIRVIMGNPPYSAGQKSENDNAANIAYPYLDSRIRQTYVAKSSAVLNKGVYDSYIRAIRWASDKIGESGVIGYVTNAGWIDSSSADGFRQCLAEEFSSIYVFHLRGNARTKGEQRRKEKDNVFGIGSRAPIAISILVKNPCVEKQGEIYFHDIGDYLTREEKLEKIAGFANIDGIAQADGWKKLVPDTHGDWLNQRDPNFSRYIVLGDKKETQTRLFENFSLGVVTNRDAWCYNASKQALAANMKRMIGFYNIERERFHAAYGALDKKAREEKVNDFLNTDATKISWTRALKGDISKNKVAPFNKQCIVPSLYRPFTRQYLYFDRQFNEMVYQMPRIFPDETVENRVICLTVGHFSVLMTNIIPDLHMIGDAQCFPLYLYEESKGIQPGQMPQPDIFGNPAESGLFDENRPAYTRKDAITDEGLAHFRQAYPGEAISKEDIFYYIYGLLHSEDYRARYADNLMKELPRIPCVKTAEAFRHFSNAGRKLAALHLNYETAAPYPLQISGIDLLSGPEDYRIVKMRYGKTGKEKDLTTIIYNERITITGIPPEAYGYIVNGKPALDWVVERQAVATDKASGIVNDANNWAIETMRNPKYPLELISRVVTVSLETMKIVRTLPELDI
ncbi:MAG: N-6 DNA methylase [Oxalobacter formigenes]|nr:N-6 DNA methylase [Oxalobacter formigenes]